jgi:hypothetical protein
LAERFYREKPPQPPEMRAIIVEGNIPTADFSVRTTADFLLRCEPVFEEGKRVKIVFRSPYHAVMTGPQQFALKS